MVARPNPQQVYGLFEQMFIPRGLPESIEHSIISLFDLSQKSSGVGIQPELNIFFYKNLFKSQYDWASGLKVKQSGRSPSAGTLVQFGYGKGEIGNYQNRGRHFCTRVYLDIVSCKIGRSRRHQPLRWVNLTDNWQSDYP